MPAPRRSLLEKVYHIIPTDSQQRPLSDALAEEILVALERSAKEAVSRRP